jgi:predicted dehydrogenase
MLKFGFIGCGLATFERAKALPENSITSCLDGYDKVEKQFCFTYNSKSVSFDEMLSLTDAIFVCTPHEFLYDYSLKALQAGKHVLIEKPGAVFSHQLIELQKIARENNVVCHIGYTIGNILSDLNLLINEPNTIQANYCHGARIGYDKEWRMRSSSHGGGVSYDLLSHILHLSLLCDKDLEFAAGAKSNSFWKSEGEDIASLILKGKNGNHANLFASCSDWKKNFLFSMNSDDTKIEIKNVNARNGDFELIKHLNTGPGIIPSTESKSMNKNFWIADTILFLNKINDGHTTDLTTEIKVLEILEQF